MATFPHFLRVEQHTARNPVARAVAKAELERAVRDFSISLYLLQQGENVAAGAIAASHFIMVSIQILNLRGQSDSVPARIMTGGISALAQLSDRGFVWLPRDTVAIETALQRAFEVSQSAGATEARNAWVTLQSVNQRIKHEQTHPNP